MIKSRFNGVTKIEKTYIQTNKQTNILPNIVNG